MNGERRPDGAFRPATSERARRKRLTIYLPTELLERMRNTVYWTPGLTLAGLIEEAVRESLQRMELANAGAFPPRLAELKGGRPKGRRGGRQPVSSEFGLREMPIAK